MTPRRVARQVAEVFLFCLCMLFIPFLPRRSVVALSRFLGNTGFRLSKKLRRIGMANLDVAFGNTITDSEKERILEASFRTFALVVMDLLWFAVFRKRRIGARVRFDPSFANYFDARPVVVVTAHVGNWEIMGQAAALRGDPTASVAAPLDNPVIDRAINSLRQSTGQTVVPKDGAIRRLLRVLHDDGKIALLIDQNTLPADGGVFVKLFGLPVSMSPAAGMLAAKTGAKIVFCYCVIDENGDYTACASPVVSGSDRQKGTQIIAGVLETVIRKHPEQWLWTYKRWKYIPEDMPVDAYPFYARRIPKA
jgi:Kdo2-lipid IVA lauroyltransferase/acyltransferase